MHGPPVDDVTAVTRRASHRSVESVVANIHAVSPICAGVAKPASADAPAPAAASTIVRAAVSQMIADAIVARSSIAVSRASPGGMSSAPLAAPRRSTGSIAAVSRSCPASAMSSAQFRFPRTQP